MGQRAEPSLTTFNGGEVSPLVVARADFAKFPSAAATLENFISTVQGPIRRRTGTQDIGAAKLASGTPFVLIPFEASATAVFVIEVGAGYFRFWDVATRRQIMDSAGSWSPFVGSTPAELANAFTGVDLLDTVDNSIRLQWAQSNDVMWIASGRLPPIKLQRIATYKFTAPYISDGVHPWTPFKDIRPAETITIVSSAETVGAATTLNASGAAFRADMVNRYLYLEQPAADVLPPWETNKAVVIGDRRRSDGRNYVALTSANTGTVKPTHSSGTKSDGGVVWEWTDDGFGVVSITAYTSATQVSGTVLVRLPKSVTAAGTPGITTRWAEGAWNDVDGFPTSVAFFRERLWWGRGQQVWASVAGDFENYAYTDGGQVTADMAIAATLAADRSDRVQWMRASNSALLIGTHSGEYVVSEQTTAEPIGPANVKATQVSGHGTRNVRPLKINEALLFVQRGGERVRELVYDFSSDGYTSADLTVLSEHILRGTLGLAALVYQRSPDPVLWGMTATGRLVGATYERTQQVVAWHRHPIGGLGTAFGTASPGVQAICAVPSVVDPGNDEVWMIVKRGATTANFRSRVEVIGPHQGAVGDWQYHDLTDVAEANYLDGSRVIGITAGQTIVPIDWIANGEQVQVLASGMVLPVQAVSSGAITVTPAAVNRRARVGFPYQSNYRSLPIFGATLARFVNAVVRVYKTVGFLIGSDSNDLARCEMRKQNSPMDVAVPLQTGDFEMRLEGGHETTRQIYIRADQPLPLTVCGIYPTARTEAR